MSITERCRVSRYVSGKLPEPDFALIFLLLRPGQIQRSSHNDVTKRSFARHRKGLEQVLCALVHIGLVQNGGQEDAGMAALIVLFVSWLVFRSNEAATMTSRKGPLRDAIKASNRFSAPWSISDWYRMEVRRTPVWTKAQRTC